MRTRYDKTENVKKYKRKYGNNIEIANRVWHSIKNGFTIADIISLSTGVLKGGMYLPLGSKTLMFFACKCKS